MDEKIIAVYCLCDDLLKGLRHGEDSQSQMSDAEVMTTTIVAAQFFRGNIEKARHFLKAPRYIPRMLSQSRFHRRLYHLRSLFLTLFALLGEVWKQLHADSIYAIDTFAACDNYRIRRARLY